MPGGRGASDAATKEHCTSVEKNTDHSASSQVHDECERSRGVSRRS
jgi:hypothetical protein